MEMQWYLSRTMKTFNYAVHISWVFAKVLLDENICQPSSAILPSWEEGSSRLVLFSPIKVITVEFAFCENAAL